MKEKMEMPEKSKEEKPKATDMELALFYANHIDNPLWQKFNHENLKISGNFICSKPRKFF